MHTFPNTNLVEKNKKRWESQMVITPMISFHKISARLELEFTGLISWTKGASIGWHSDDNRSYLKQRDFADVIMYTADSRNIHAVDEIIGGERLTLTLWFSRDSLYEEDAKLISLFPRSCLSSLDDDPASSLPFSAPSNMYWFSSEQAPSNHSGFDIRWARVHVLGYSFCFLDDKIPDSTSDSPCDSAELLMKPLWLAREDEIFIKEFSNSLHALQVVQFYCWKIFEQRAINGRTGDRNVIELFRSVKEKTTGLKSTPVGDHKTAQMVFHPGFLKDRIQSSFNWSDFRAAVVVWEDYTCQLRQGLFASLPFWRTHQSIFPVPSAE